ncbi:MAG: helix-turn-helix domain-containing protein [Proteobacteria bacterium]|nr:helix-turn-helix domain-containing protein [Pseudomonadota bacterium]
MITGKQIRAARIFLDWDAEDLAAKAGVNRETVFNIERGTVQARPGTIDKIVKAFNDHRVEFIEDQGVRYKPDGIQVLNGREGLITLMEDIYNSCRQGVAGDIVLSGVSEDDFQKHLGDYDETYMKNMRSLPHVHMRCLIQEGDKNFVSSSYAEYRWSPKSQFKAVPFYAYADKLAIILFSPGAKPKIYMIQSIEIAEAYRAQFESMWNTAIEVNKAGKKL